MKFLLFIIAHTTLIIANSWAQAGMWTWVKGSNGLNYLGNFGTLGQKVFHYEEKIYSPHWKKTIDLSDEPPGIYLLQLKSDELFIQQKVMISK